MESSALSLESDPNQSGSTKGFVSSKTSEYIPAAEDAQRNFVPTARLNDSNTDETRRQAVLDDLRTGYDQRLKKVFHDGYQSILKEIATFLRLKVEIRIVPEVRDRKKGLAHELSLVIDRHQTIERLAAQIEAEFAFMNITDDTENQDLITSLRVIMLTDVGSVPLKYHNSIENVVNNGDVIIAIGVLIEGSKDQYLKQLTETRFSNLTHFWHKKDNRPSTMNDASNEMKLFGVLHHAKSGIFLFQEYCMEDFEIENLLFWLEVEVFRGIAESAVESEGSRELILSPRNKYYPDLLLHARYIYYTFLAPKATLRLNLRFDLISRLKWPLPQVDPVSGMHHGLELDAFDELQEHVYLNLAYLIYPKFEKSRFYTQWMEQFSVDKSAWIFPGTHFQKFPQDKIGMERAILEALHFDEFRNPEAGIKHEQYPVHRQDARRFTKELLSPYESIRQMPPGNEQLKFFGDGLKLTVAQKQRRVLREKRLKRFFGDKPTIEDPYEEAKHWQFGVTTKRDSTVDDSGVDSKGSAARSVPQYLSPPTTEENLHYRKKKVEKLEDFFGVAKIPVEQMFEQKLIGEISLASGADSDHFVVPATTNNLSPSSKKKLMHKGKKLREMFGEPLQGVLAEKVLSTTLHFNEEGEDDSKKSSEQMNSDRRPARSSSVDSRTSLVTISDKAKRMLSDKDRKRKKLEKIQDFLGERITSQLLDEAARNSSDVERDVSLVNISGKERVVLQRRFNKLQNLFGEVPPNDAVLPHKDSTIATTEKSESDNALAVLTDIVGGERVLEFLLSSEKTMTDLILILDEFDDEYGAPIEALEDIFLSASNDQLNGDQEAIKGRKEIIANHVVNARQRRRLGKLTKFFGSPAGAFSPELTNEDKIVQELSKHLKGIVMSDAAGTIAEQEETN